MDVSFFFGERKKEWMFSRDILERKSGQRARDTTEELSVSYFDLKNLKKHIKSYETFSKAGLLSHIDMQTEKWKGGESVYNYL